MRALDVALAAVVLVVLLALLWYLLGHRDRVAAGRAERSAAWHAHDVSRDGVTHVVVRRTQLDAEGATVELESRQVAAVPDADPEYEALLSAAMQRARSRAELLNRERDGG